ncbi:MAG TPA: DctP family TRAP transporter solute-binding subunit [Candidatus Limnocylindria bacterium]|nr:DctP family TRAP transporter solute-binding subunit [Candidatus Limnocylindria bacterium]
MSRRPRTFILALAALLVLAACSGASTSPTASASESAADQSSAPASEPAQEEVELTLAHSYQDGQPQVDCGANVIRDEVEAADVGLTIEIFGASQLGGDADRIQSVIAGDIDIDIQGASALSAVYAPMSVVDGAFVFDDSEHLYNFFTSEASDALKEGFEEETGVHILGAWNTGARQFTANVPIRTPADLEGLRMRFPPSPTFLLNADAMGAEAVEVAFEELYLALQQGTVDGQENPITNIDAINLDEVQDYVSLSSHQLSSNLVIIGEVWNELSAEQQEALTAAVEEAMIQEPECAAEAEEEILAAWRESGNMEIVEDVDREAFRELAEPYLRDHFDEAQLEVLEAIRSTAE